MATQATHWRLETRPRRAWWRAAWQAAPGYYPLLPIAVVAALVWANAWPDSYFAVARVLAFPVNQIGMALFFGLIAQEIHEEVMPGGALHGWRRWMAPVVAAVGGAAGSALVYRAVVASKIEPLLGAGWPSASAVDIAFVYFTVRLIFHRPAALAFALVLAVAANAVALLAVAPSFLWSASRVDGAVLLIVPAIVTALWLRRRNVRQFWPYIWICGALSWLALYLEGIHPALALVPIVPFMPHTRRGLGDFLDDDDAAAAPAPRHFERVWHHHVHVVLVLFGLVNAGVVLSGYGTGTWATLLGSGLGKTLGIVGGAAAAVALGLHLPSRLLWREVLVIGLAASAGMTFAMFVATTLYPAGPLLGELKLGALLTAGGVVVAPLAAWLLRVGRFAPDGRGQASLPRRASL